MEAPLSNRYAEMAELSKKYKPMYYTADSTMYYY